MHIAVAVNSRNKVAVIYVAINHQHILSLYLDCYTESLIYSHIQILIEKADPHTPTDNAFHTVFNAEARVDDSISGSLYETESSSDGLDTPQRRETSGSSGDYVDIPSTDLTSTVFSPLTPVPVVKTSGHESYECTGCPDHVEDPHSGSLMTRG